MCGWIAKVRDKEREFRSLQKTDYRVQAILGNALVKAKTQLRHEMKWHSLEIELPEAENSGIWSDNQQVHLETELPEAENSSIWSDNQRIQLAEETSRVMNSTVICLETEMNSSDHCSTRCESSAVSFKYGFLRPLVNFLGQVISRSKSIYHLVFNWHR